MNLLSALNWRYAVRKFSAQKVPQDKITTLMEATRLSASSYGLQPYKVLVIKSHSIRQQLLAHSFGQDKVVNCSHLIVIASQTNIGDHTVDSYLDRYLATTKQPAESITGYSNHMKSSLEKMTKQQQQEWAHQQSYIALGNLLTSAALLQIDSCPMTGFDRDGYDQVLNLKQQALTASIICALGYRDAQDLAASRTKVRLDYQEMVMEL
ncbi:NAD(P)H-dependent oxidoreductase [Thalassotalea insulae]|uniref:NAD(P)H-dependent oxidoreductase n=1 Tax=Thalassotalea insulae TaxID=2056778 RepID=A0ABQ6GUM5_9GAMM|nr:NAD(P)H-dependent oxidoreductase [Thalassotalea insulae]GLX79628.1 NAD(P)H-dependent oxidoreductase [Thalassotalea insulae]